MINLKTYYRAIFGEENPYTLRVIEVIEQKIKKLDKIYSYFNEKNNTHKSTKLIISKNTVRLLSKDPESFLAKRLLNKYKTENKLLRRNCPNFINIGVNTNKNDEVLFWTKKSLDELLKHVADKIMLVYLRSLYRQSPKIWDKYKMNEKHDIIIKRNDEYNRVVRGNGEYVDVCHKIYELIMPRRVGTSKICNKTISILTKDHTPEKEKTSIGTFTNKLFDVLEAKKNEPKIYAKITEDIENISKGLESKRIEKIKNINDRIVIYKGDEIPYMYKEWRAEPFGSLGNSCMRRENIQNNRFNIYSKNPETIKMATVTNEKGKICSRTILYKTGEEWKYSRIYSCSKRDELMLKTWLKLKGLKEISIQDKIVLKPDIWTKTIYVDKIPIFDNRNHLLSGGTGMYKGDDPYLMVQSVEGKVHIYAGQLTTLKVWNEVKNDWSFIQSGEVAYSQVLKRFVTAEECVKVIIKDKLAIKNRAIKNRVKANEVIMMPRVDVEEIQKDTEVIIC